MKLNLLPTSATKGKGVVRAWVFSGILSVAAIAAAIWMIVTSNKASAEAMDAANSEKPKADMVTAAASKADDVIKLAEPFERNTNLVMAMDRNVLRYPEFYKKIRTYIPSFFRVTSMTAVPASDSQVALTLTGIIKDQDQYNDLVLALMRIPASNIQRQLIPHDDLILPNVVPGDTDPVPYRSSEGRIPQNADQQLNYYLAKGGVSGFVNAGGFGADGRGRRGAMPNFNEVQLAMTVPGNLQVPNVRGTLALSGSAPAPAAPGGAAATTPAAAPASVPVTPGARGAAGAQVGD